ncbi:MAG: GNAT family N-acetyltransferase [Clostridiales bacterium]|nr:GNAT family N-acetyltransferase [Clostridiales bacterium]
MRSWRRGSCGRRNSTGNGEKRGSAVEACRHLCFVPTDTEELTDGLCYTPMRFDGSGPPEEAHGE